MIDRERIRRRVIDKINYGYSTHRVMNKILEESLLELAEVLIEEIEKRKECECNKPIDHKRK